MNLYCNRRETGFPNRIQVLDYRSDAVNVQYARLTFLISFSNELHNKRNNRVECRITRYESPL